MKYANDVHNEFVEKLSIGKNVEYIFLFLVIYRKRISTMGCLFLKPQDIIS